MSAKKTELQYMKEVSKTLVENNVRLESLEKFARSNQIEIRELRSYINMGKGGIKSIFVMATFIAMIVSGLKLFKEFF